MNLFLEEISYKVLSTIVSKNIFKMYLVNADILKIKLI